MKHETPMEQDLNTQLAQEKPQVVEEPKVMKKEPVKKDSNTLVIILAVILVIFLLGAVGFLSYTLGKDAGKKEAENNNVQQPIQSSTTTSEEEVVEPETTTTTSETEGVESSEFSIETFFTYLEDEYPSQSFERKNELIQTWNSESSGEKDLEGSSLYLAFTEDNTTTVNEISSKAADYLNDYDFEGDPYNTATGPAMSLDGFQKDNMICLISIASATDITVGELTITCGEEPS